MYIYTPCFYRLQPSDLQYIGHILSFSEAASNAHTTLLPYHFNVYIITRASIMYG